MSEPLLYYDFLVVSFKLYKFGYYVLKSEGEFALTVITSAMINYEAILSNSEVVTLKHIKCCALVNEFVGIPNIISLDMVIKFTHN